LLIVDNCSTDDTAEVARQLQSQYPNIRYHRNNSNIGRVENWDRVIELARGQYLIIMNINDRFMPVNLTKHISYLENHPEIALVLTDMQFADHVYPNWAEEGVIDMNSYLEKTFLDTEYLEFHSLGVLHQHILRTADIINHRIKFNPEIPRTTDRVFIGEVVKAGGGKFYYSKDVMVSWHLNNGRYHFSVHNNPANFNFNQLWLNEYVANVQLAQISNIPYKKVLQSQLVLARFYMQVKWLRNVKNKLLNCHTVTNGMEIPTASAFYAYLKTMAELNEVTINYISISRKSLARALNWYLRSVGLARKNKRTLQGIIQPA
jgi:glycosyltransferase involved in cell wall biosynthesis